jgi:hypothetical protein
MGDIGQPQFIECVEVKLTERGKQFGGPISSKDVDHVMLNLCRESQGCIHSFKLISI